MRQGPRPEKYGGGAEGGQRTETCPSCRGDYPVDTFVFCKTCKKILCEKCRSNKHGRHETTGVDAVASGVRKNASDYASPGSTQTKFGDIQQMEELTERFTDEVLVSETDKIDQIRSHINSLHQELDQICEALIKDVSDVAKEDLKNLNKVDKEAKKLGASISAMCESAKQISAEADDFKVVTHGYSLCEELREALDTELAAPVRGRAIDVQFVPGCSDRTNLEGMCGQIAVMSMPKPALQTTPTPRPGKGVPKTLPVQSPSPASGAAQKVVGGLRRTTSVSVPGGLSVWVGGLCVVDEDTAWVGGLGVVTQVRVTGGQTVGVCKRVGVCDDESWCFLTRTDDGMYVASREERKVYRLSEDGQLSLLSSFSFYPRGLTSLSPGCVLVCGWSEGLYEVTGRGAQRVDLGGSVERAWDVAVNSDGDIAVVDYNGRRVCIFTREYKLVHTYSPTDKSPTDKSAPFSPSGVTCDGDNFVISDYSGAIHVLDRRGVCLVVHRTADDCKKGPGPVAMSPSGRLWARFSGGTVCIYDMV